MLCTTDTDLRPPVRAAEVSPEWIAPRRAIIARDGPAVRAGAALAIEIQAASGAWLRLTLPNGGTAFATPADRDTVLAALIAR